MATQTPALQAAVLLLLLACGQAQVSPDSGYLALCVLARDANRDIREFVEYHLWAGVDRIFLFDHNSTRPLLNEISDFVVAGAVQYTYFTTKEMVQAKHFKHGIQGRVYSQCLQMARGTFTFLGFIDVDEFIVVTMGTETNIKSVLQQYEEYGALGVNWVNFGTSGVEERAPGQGVLDTFTQCTAPNPHTKVIVKVNETESVGTNAHFFLYKDGQIGVSENFERLASGHRTKEASVQKIAVYHYLLKSKAEFMHRFQTNPYGVSGFTKKNPDMMRLVDSYANHTCVRAKEAAEKIRQQASKQTPAK